MKEMYIHTRARVCVCVIGYGKKKILKSRQIIIQVQTKVLKKTTPPPKTCPAHLTDPFGMGWQEDYIRLKELVDIHVKKTGITNLGNEERGS